MKKIFTTLCLASLCLAASAQDLTVTVDGKPVENGATVTSSTVVPVEMDGVVYFWDLKPEIHMASAKGNEISVTAKNVETTVKYVGKDEEAGNLSFCGVVAVGGPDGQCTIMKPGQTQSAAVTLGANVKGELQLYFMSIDNVNPAPEKLDSKSEVKITSGSETIEFTLNMVYPAADSGVEAVAGEAQFSVVGGSIVADGEVEVYDLAGRRVANQDLNGMYIVRAAGKTAKVAVK